MENKTKNSFVLPIIIAALVIIVVVVVAAVRSKNLEAPVVTNSPEVSASPTPSLTASVKPIPGATQVAPKPKPVATPTATVTNQPATANIPITVAFPNGGETIKKGSRYMITWNISPAFKAAYPQVVITLLAGNQNQTVLPPVSITTANTGSYDWFVPSGSITANLQDNTGAYRMTQVEGKQVLKIQIQGYPLKTGESQAPFDFSTDYFTIIN